MNNLSGILKQKSKALSVFEKAKTRMEEVVQSFQVEVDEALKRIQTKKDEIKEEESAIQMARAEINSGKKVIEKIEGILG